MKTLYHIAIANEPRKLEAAVQDKLNNGWKVTGGVAVSQTIGKDPFTAERISGRAFLQAMTKEEN